MIEINQGRKFPQGGSIVLCGKFRSLKLLEEEGCTLLASPLGPIRQVVKITDVCTLAQLPQLLRSRRIP